MAPPQVRKSVAKDKIASLFAQAKTQSYYDPVSRGPGSHTMVSQALDRYRINRTIATQFEQTADYETRIRTIAWSPTGHLIATGSVDRTLRIWNPDKPQVKYSTELRGHSASVEKVAWNPVKEAELASVSSDGTCRFWDVRSRNCIAEVPIGGEGITIAWAEDGSMVMVGRKDDTLVPISVPSYTAHAHEPQNVQTNQIVFAPLLSDSTMHTLLLTTGAGTIKICSYPRDINSSSSTLDQQPSLTPATTNGTTTQPSNLNPNTSNTSNASNSNLTITNGNSSTTATTSPSLSSSSRLKLRHTLSSHTSSCFCLELCPTGRWLATGGSDALICLWDTREWVCRRSLDRMVGSVRGLGFSFDGAYAVGGSDEGTGLEIAHVESGEYVCSLPTPTPCPCVAWHPNRYWLAYSGDSGGLRIVGAAGGPL